MWEALNAGGKAILEGRLEDAAARVVAEKETLRPATTVDEIRLVDGLAPAEPSDGSGIAVFDALSMTQAADNYVFRAKSGALIEALSNPFAILPSAPDTMSFIQQPVNSIAGAVISRSGPFPPCESRRALPPASRR